MFVGMVTCSDHPPGNFLAKVLSWSAEELQKGGWTEKLIRVDRSISNWIHAQRHKYERLLTQIIECNWLKEIEVWLTLLSDWVILDHLRSLYRRLIVDSRHQLCHLTFVNLFKVADVLPWHVCSVGGLEKRVLINICRHDSRQFVTSISSLSEIYSHHFSKRNIFRLITLWIWKPNSLL